MDCRWRRFGPTRGEIPFAHALFSRHRCAHGQRPRALLDSPDAAPTLVNQGTNDDHVTYEQGIWLVSRLQAAWEAAYST